MAYDNKPLLALELFKRLIKDGCQWHGDVLSKKWSECLYFTEDNVEAVERTLETYGHVEGLFKREDFAVWIL